MNEALAFPLHAFEQAVYADDDVLGVLYTGSLGHGTTDHFSDLDIVAWVRDDALDACSTTLEHILRYLGDVQFFYGSSSAATGFVTQDWRRVDLDLKRQTDLLSAPKYVAAHVVKDTDDVLARLVANSPAQPVTTTLEQAERTIQEAIDSQIYLALHNARGAVWSATGEISYRCAELYTFLARLRGRESFGLRYVETQLGAEEQVLLGAAWPAAPMEAEVRRAARALWRWTRHVWQEAERVHNRPLAVMIDEAALLAAVDRIYTWRQETNGAATIKR